ncbi:Germin-like protein [Dirofilaria immitis]
MKANKQCRNTYGERRISVYIAAVKVRNDGAITISTGIEGSESILKKGIRRNDDILMIEHSENEIWHDKEGKDEKTRRANVHSFKSAHFRNTKHSNLDERSATIILKKNKR